LVLTKGWVFEFEVCRNEFLLFRCLRFRVELGVGLGGVTVLSF
jgi:hypothetical protein